MNRTPVRRFVPTKSLRSRLFCRRLEDRLAPAIFTVTNLSDSAPGSLRAAINSANLAAGADSIVFQGPGGLGTITLTSGELQLFDAVTITSPGLGAVTVSGNNDSRVFNTSQVDGGDKVSFISMIIVNGNGVVAGGGSGAIDGGGIFAVDEAISLTNCIVSGNSATDDGGAIIVFFAPGSLTLLNSTITNNHADGSGGAVQLGPGVVATITNCVITGNTAMEKGGAIYCSGSSLTLTNSTLSGNSAANGGGLGWRGTVGASGFIVRNSTLSGNTATGTGGAIALDIFTGDLAVQNSTITNNTAGGSGGGGIGRISGTGEIILDSTIVAGNTDTVAGNEDLFTTQVVVANFSAVGTSVGVGQFFFDSVSSLLLGKNSMLGPLASNGGAGQTHVPAPDSPVINMGSNPAALTTDQRSSPTARDSNGGVDIGSVELQVFLVNNTNDGGAGSLRTAVTNANSYGGADTVAFDPVVFATPQSIKLLTALPNITGDVNFKGTSAANVTVTRDGAAPAFRLFNCAVSGVGIVSFSNMTLTGGSATANGAGIFAADDALTITNCVISNNVTTTRGGGISFIAGGSVTVINSTISGNSAQGGGGIYCFSTGTLIIDNCTISGNTASQSLGGGGVLNMSSTVTIRNSTISGNHATGGAGGGITLQNAPAAVTIQNSTIAFNDATTTGGGIQRTAGTLSIESTLVAKNTAVTDGADVFGTVNFAKFNLIGATDGSTGIADPSNKTGTKASPLDPLLGALTNNGGPTQTHALLAGGPAINTGNNSTALANDQRGPGFARVIGLGVDIGAFELQTTPPRLHDGIINGGLAQRSRVTQVKFIFNTIVTLPVNPETAFQLKRNSDNAPIGVVALVTNGATTDVNLTFTGPLVESGSLPDGRYTLTILASQVTANGFQLDGNGDGVGGDNHVVLSSGTGGIFRIFGDADGDGTVAANDFIQFRLALGGNNATFDFDGDGAVAASDFIQFRLRFGGSI